MKKKIAVYANGWGASNLSYFIDGIKKITDPENIDIFTFLSFSFYGMDPADESGDTSIFRLADMKDFDGVIVFSNGLNGTEIAREIVNRAIAAKVPAVSLGIPFPDISCVTTNNKAGMNVLCEHLVNEHNVRKVIYLAGNEGNPDSEERQRCLEEALEKAGGTLEEVHYTNWATDHTVEYIDAKHSTKDNLPDAFVCANDYIALSACFRLNYHGISVPNDVLVTGFDCISDALTFYPSLTTVKQDYAKQGTACAEIIMDMINSGDITPVTKYIDSEFFPGESCGCENGGSGRKARDEACRKAYEDKNEKVFFNDHLTGMENTLYACSSVGQIGNTLTGFYLQDHRVEGDNFYILAEKSYGTSIYNDEVKLTRNNFSDELKVIVAIKEGERFEAETISNKQLIPGYDGESPVPKNFVFVPIHSNDILYGYIVMGDCMSRVEDFSLEIYRRALRNALEKYRQNMKLEYLNKKLMELYTRDSLTGLYNRFGYECLAVPLFAKAMEEKKTCAVIFMDIDRMKHINDNFGHLQGDLAIRTIANVISMTAPPNWICIRYGGDEYLIIGECSDENEVKALVSELAENEKRQVTHMMLPFTLEASIGYIMTDPGSSYTLAEYVKKADDIMYEAKKQTYEKDKYERSQR